MSGWELQYYGVRFIGIHTNEFEQVTIRDDSNTDQWYSEFTIGVSAVINLAVFAAANQKVGVIGNRVQGGSAAETCRNLQARFEDRKPFALILDNTIVLQSDSTTDANNGPKVVRAVFKPMGANSIMVNVVIKVSKIPCTENPTPVIGNRWQVSDEIDDQWRTTRTWRGKLRLCNAIHNPQAFREMVIPQLSDGFQRVRMHFTGELNGLELSYEIVDRQLVGDAPPAPGVRMAGTHTETLNQNGASSVGEVYVRLDGPPGTDKQVLLENCMRVINSRVQADRFAAQQKNGWIWKELIVTDFFGPDVCAIEARARVQRAIEITPEGGHSLRLGNLLTQTLGQPLDLGGNYNRFKMVPPAAYPTTTIGLFACQLQSPCEDNHRMPQAAAQIDAGSGDTGTSEYDPTTTTYDPSGTPLEIDSPGYDISHTEAMYTHCNVEWIIDKNHGYVQLPYGDQLPQSDSTSAMIRLHAPTAKLKMKLAAERVGEWPAIPSDERFTDAAGIVYTPLYFVPNFRPAEQQGDGRQLHVIDVTAVYAMSRCPTQAEYVLPHLPWDNLRPVQLPSNTFVSLASG